MNKAIKIAIEKGGYRDGEMPRPTACTELYTLDPLFWKALGKALGWNICKEKCSDCDSHYSKVVFERYTDAVWSGDTDTFWEELLNRKE